ncbi:MAG: protein kinase [Magnetococcales bacterium]|nr:protein kinase [Magnetococcales bacterium]
MSQPNNIDPAISLPKPFHLLETVYRGPLFYVVRALRMPEKQPVILKLLHSRFHAQTRTLRNQVGFQIQQGMNGSGIVSAISYHESLEYQYCVYEDVKATSLDFIYANSSMDIATFFKLALPLTTALGRLHGQGCIHMDLTPSHILWSLEKELPYLTGFRFAVRPKGAKEERESIPPNDESLAYISPERTGRTNQRVDHRTDFYSLGAIFYRLLAGSPPFKADHTGGWIHAHLAHNAIAPHQKNHKIPQGLSLLVLKLLSKDPEERYQSAEGLLADLHKCFIWWQEKEEVSPFTLGDKDFSPTFRIPKKIYGREKELALLTSFIDKNNSTPLA